MANRFFESKDHVSSYGECRPTYSNEVYERIVSYLHKQLAPDKSGKLPVAIDVGCGTGNKSTYQLTKYFHKVVGVDVSPAMIDCAKKWNTHPEIDFRVSPAEKLPVDDNSVTLVCVATALHWFDTPVFYKEVDRVLQPGGVVAAFTYSPTMTVCDYPNHERLTEILREFHLGNLHKGYWSPSALKLLNKNTDEKLQIPYTERIRDEGIKLTVHTNLEKFMDFAKSTSVIRKMFEAEPDYSNQWWSEMKQKLIKAYGSDDLSSKLSYTMDVILIMGRKPQIIMNKTLQSPKRFP